ncbi:MAG: two pore domain potassium channel family protein, partial [Desulfobacula sp.]|nr:two pore domain potassium channel family protein [Desulfobacula sp.]
MNRLQHIIRAIIISWIIFALGVIGYMLIEKWSFLDAVYMTAITVTTAGFMEVHELSSAGRIFTSIV